MLPLHPLCTFFPRIEGQEFEEFKADIARCGQRDPIVMFEGMVLDGGNRARACAELGKEPLTVEFDGNDPVAFVLSRNLSRRHLSAAQRAAIVAAAADWSTAHTHGGLRKPDQGANLHLEPAGSPSTSSVKDRAALAGVARRTQIKADKVAKADPTLAREVAAGHVSLEKAVAQVEGKPEPTTPAKPEKKATPTPAPAPDTDGDPMADLMQDMDELRERNRVLEAELKTVQSDSPAAEALRWQRMYEHSQAEQKAAMERAATATETRDWYARQLKRCGKAVGQDDPDKIAAAVEAFVRQHKAVKA